MQAPVAFEVELPKTTESPLIKKRLEAESQAAPGSAITLEKIQEKLQKADEKRRLNLTNPTSRLDKKRVYKVSERKRSIDEQKEQSLKQTVEKTFTLAQEKRDQALTEKKKNVQKHLEKVEKVRKLKTLTEQQELEKQKEELDHKLENAEKKRLHALEEKVKIAHLSAEKKPSTTAVAI
jgi:hypothetical protein